MPRPNPVVRVLPVALATLVLVAGCDRAKPRAGAGPSGPLPNGADAPAPTAPTVPTPPTSTEPLPPVPDWAQSYMGKTLTSLVPAQSTDCVGNTDDVDMHYAGATTGVRIEGWGWDKTAKAPVAHILLVDDKSGEVVGAGQTGKARPDVNKARPEVTSPTTGWEAITSQTTDGVYAWGVMSKGKAVCKLGHINL